MMRVDTFSGTLDTFGGAAPLATPRSSRSLAQLRALELDDDNVEEGSWSDEETTSCSNRAIGGGIMLMVIITMLVFAAVQLVGHHSDNSLPLFHNVDVLDEEEASSIIERYDVKRRVAEQEQGVLGASRSAAQNEATVFSESSSIVLDSENTVQVEADVDDDPASFTSEKKKKKKKKNEENFAGSSTMHAPPKILSHLPDHIFKDRRRRLILVSMARSGIGTA
jgi:hypothetical protein